MHTSLTTSFSTSTSRSCAQRAFVYKGHCIFPEPWRATESGLPSGGAGKSAEVAMPWPGMYAAVAGGCTLKTIFSTSTTTLTSLITVLPPRPPAMTRCGYAVRPSLPLPPRPQCACDHDGAPRAALGSAHPDSASVNAKWLPTSSARVCLSLKLDLVFGPHRAPFDGNRDLPRDDLLRSGKHALCQLRRVRTMSCHLVRV